MNSMEKTREFLKSIGLPGGDAYDLPTSENDLRMVASTALKFPEFKARK